MAQLASFQDLLALLYAERRLLDALFAQRHLPARSPAAALLATLPHDPERVAQLVDMGLLIEQAGRLDLAPPLLALGEAGLETDYDTHQGTGYAAALQQHLTHYVLAPPGPPREGVLRVLKQVLTALHWQLPRDLRAHSLRLRQIEAGGGSLAYRQHLLSHLLQGLEASLALMADLQARLKADLFFRLPVDDELDHLALDLRECLQVLTGPAEALGRQLRLQIQAGTDAHHPLSKLRRIKYLKDAGTLREKSNLEAMLKGRQAVLFQGRRPVVPRLSLADLTTDLGRGARLKARARRRPGPSRPAPIEPAQRIPLTAHQPWPDLDHLFSAFMAGSQDLISFLRTQDPTRSLAANSQLFCQLMGRFAASLSLGVEMVEYEGISFLAVWPPAAAPVTKETEGE